MTKLLALTLAGSLALVVMQPYAATITAHAEVLDVQPLYEASASRLERSQCLARYQEVSSADSLVADIRRQRCLDGYERQQKREVSGYRVTWRYGQLTGKQVIRQRPGKTVPVRVRFDPVVP